jgi:hypothetical protein
VFSFTFHGGMNGKSHQRGEKRKRFGEFMQKQTIYRTTHEAGRRDADSVKSV